MKLLSKIVLECIIKTETGLAIGAGREALEIGGLNSPVIKTPNGIPFIPGSSLKGKIRSLLEREKYDLSPLKAYRDKETQLNAELKRIKKEKGGGSDEYKEKQKEVNKELSQNREKLDEKDNWRHIGGPFIHICKNDNCDVCVIFGRPGEEESSQPTRLYARDAHLDTEKFKEMFPELAETNLFTEAKFENVIDRLTSAANPRHFERIPAGAQFNGEFVFNIYEEMDKERFKTFLKTLQLLEDDYLGSSGSRGYGKIKIEQITNKVKNVDEYGTDKPAFEKEYGNLEEILSDVEKTIFPKIKVDKK